MYHSFYMHFVLALLLVLAGCSDPNRQKLVGTWILDEVELVIDQVNDQAEPTSSSMLVQFENSGKLLTETAIGNINSQKRGKWELIEFDVQSGDLPIECLLQGQKTRHNIQFDDAELIRWIPPNMAGTEEEMQFRKR
ncbi:MAG: hypothetical protein AAGA30_12315 [Planctomycetota bacterium]